MIIYCSFGTLSSYNIISYLLWLKKMYSIANSSSHCTRGFFSSSVVSRGLNSEAGSPHDTNAWCKVVEPGRKFKYYNYARNYKLPELCHRLKTYGASHSRGTLKKKYIYITYVEWVHETSTICLMWVFNFYWKLIFNAILHF